MENQRIQSDINDPEVHRKIAQKVCGWEYDERVGVWTPKGPHFIAPISYRLPKDTPFLDANAREVVIDAARLKGWCVESSANISGYCSSVWRYCELVFSTNNIEATENLKWHNTRTEAEIEALYFIAKNI